MKTTTDEMVRTADKLVVLKWRMLEANKCACGNIFATPYYLRKHDEALKELNEIRDALTADGYEVSIVNEDNDELVYGYEITVTISRAGDGEDQAVVRTLSGYMKEGKASDACDTAGEDCGVGTGACELPKSRAYGNSQKKRH